MRQETGEVAGLQARLGRIGGDEAVGVKIIEDDVVVKTLLPVAILHEPGHIAQRRRRRSDDEQDVIGQGRRRLIGAIAARRAVDERIVIRSR